MRIKSIIGFVLIAGILTTIYAPTLQTIVNGSSDDFMNDTGEVQVVLNTWGTLHATGYPIFVPLGNLFVGALKTVGVNPAAAPALFAMLWGFIALGLIYTLALHLTQRVELAAAMTLAFGLTRFAWIHSVIAEVYSFALVFQVLLLLVALWQSKIPRRLEWLAIIGGAGIAHHRGLGLSIAPVIFAVFPQLRAELAHKPKKIISFVLLGLPGWLPYIYLPIRAWMHGTWVYGDPSTLAGWWDQISARENPSIVSLPASFDVLVDKFSSTNALMQYELTGIGIVIGIIGLLLALRKPSQQRAGITLLISAISAYALMVLFLNDIFAPVVFSVSLPLAFGWLFLFDALLTQQHIARVTRIALLPLTLLFGSWLVVQNFDSIYTLTHDQTGLETIALAKSAPPGSTLMLEWGSRYFAVGFAQDVLGELKHIQRTIDKADLAHLVRTTQFVTPDYTMHHKPRRWWRDLLETRVFPRAVAPHLVEITIQPHLVPPGDQRIPREYNKSKPVVVLEKNVECTTDSINVQVLWLAIERPSRDQSVFVHLLDAQNNIIAQFDQSAPVYGWRPLTTWEPREIIQDIYPLPRLVTATTIRFGLYEQLPNGQFQNHYIDAVPVQCSPTTQ